MAIRLLIAEPDETLREVLERYFLIQGFVVGTAGTLAECIDKAVSFTPDVILSELDFSDGQADKAFKSWYEEATMPVPMVVLTRRAREKGPHFDWPVQQDLEKPSAMHRIAEAVRNCAIQQHPVCVAGIDLAS